MKSRFFLFSRILLFMSLLGASASGETLRLTLDDFVERAVARDLIVREAALSKDVAEARKAFALATPDPEVSLSYGTDALGNDEGERAMSLSLSQSIRLPGQKRALREIANAESALANSSRSLTFIKTEDAPSKGTQFTSNVSIHPLSDCPPL